ncbi:MAG: homoserine kinase [Burkholderiales bacterium]|jgi:homoserine kinase type II|nr:homoserine kinase [Burkholderiales bacterium]
MSVYTTVEDQECRAWLANFSSGNLVSMKPIASGIENTNYFVSTDQGEFVLTLYERIPEDDLPFYLNLMVFLEGHHLPVPAPQKTHHGKYYLSLKGKPAALITRVFGAPQSSPTEEQCAAIGRALAKMHRVTGHFTHTLDNPRGAKWRQTAADAVMPFLNAAQKNLLISELNEQYHHPLDHLPRGAIHADLFRDNVLFTHPNKPDIAGIIDFGFAATDAFLYDLAITVNDWCLADANVGSLDRAKLHAMLSAYQSERAPTEEEKKQWSYALRCAALRFWLSRLYDFYLPREGSLVHAHDPTHFERILNQRRNVPEQWFIETVR